MGLVVLRNREDSNPTPVRTPPVSSRDEGPTPSFLFLKRKEEDSNPWALPLTRFRDGGQDRLPATPSMRRAAGVTRLPQQDEDELR